MAPVFVVALTAFIYLKPQEFFPLLQSLPILHVLFVLLVAGAAIDVVAGKVKSPVPAQLPYVLAFVSFSLAIIVVRDPRSLPHVMSTMGISTGIYWASAVGMGTERRVWVFAVLLFGLSLFLTIAGTHQSRQEFSCFSIGRDYQTDAPVFDGRPCVAANDCEDGGRSDVDWICEKPGFWGTSSIGHGRVRYRGTLADPNELALVIATALPFGFALREAHLDKLRRQRRRHAPWSLALLAMIVGAFGWCVVESQSRGGQLVFATVVGLFFVRKFRLWGLAAGAVVALPVALWGGRAGAEADASAYDRIEAWYEAITMVRDHPILGVGPLQFVEHHNLTAHNAYLLVAAETGLPGFFLWTLCIYASLKVPWKLWWEREPGLLPSLGTLAAALLFAMIGMMVGIFFLSFAYHQVLFLFMGLAGALGIAARRCLPEFRISISLREGAVIGVVDAAFLVLMYAYTRIRV